ncbi:prepilin-type N-terminal cleavage/methylation domain-containing protein [Patescibacteria group bacterium]|nr:prepilin-type N-terminal cleavage/methylation domain-containing protein [Patescibacteria group bacterium]
MLFVIGVIVYKIRKKRKCRLVVSASHGNSGFTLLELVIAVSISMILTLGTIGFVRGINAQKNTNKIAKEVENIQSACLKMASENTNFTIDDLVSKKLITTKKSFTGGEYSVETDGKVFSISASLPAGGLLIKEFPQPITYWHFFWLGKEYSGITATYILPRGQRSLADKNWYGF